MNTKYINHRSGHIPSCPFTIEEVRKATTYEPKLATHRYLRTKAEYDIDHASYYIYRELAEAISQVQFSRFVSVRFSRALTDDIALQEANRKIKHKINKFLFGRRPSPIRYLFITEQDRIPHKTQTAYHLHFLMTAPSNINHCLTRLPKGIRLTYDKRDRLINETNLDHLSLTEVVKDDQRHQTITDPLNMIIHRKTRHTVLEGTQNLISISNVKIENIYNQECLTDYVLKQMRFREPGVEYLNSDFDFTKTS